MKFGKQLELAVSDGWQDKVVSYKRLKRIIKRRKFELDESGRQPDELAPLTGTGAPQEFWDALDRDLRAVAEFFNAERAVVRSTVNALERRQRRSHPEGGRDFASSFVMDLGELERAYLQAARLVRYADLNVTGFRKIVKKWDKATGEANLERFMEALRQQPFASDVAVVEKERIEALTSRDHLLLLQRMDEQKLQVRSGLSFGKEMFLFFRLQRQPEIIGGRTDGGWHSTDGGWHSTDGSWHSTDGGWHSTDGGWSLTNRSHSPIGALRGCECTGGPQFFFSSLKDSPWVRSGAARRPAPAGWFHFPASWPPRAPACLRVTVTPPPL